jgi:1,3-beta-glucanosyltransferase GAS1
MLKCSGIAYQLVADDPLIDKDQCARDAPLMKDLGANAIRVYHVNAQACRKQDWR